MERIMQTRSFGKSKKGEETTLYTFTNKNGMTMEVTDFGATLYALMVPDKDGNLVDVVLGYDTPVQYGNSAEQVLEQLSDETETVSEKHSLH